MIYLGLIIFVGVAIISILTSLKRQSHRSNSEPSRTEVADMLQSFLDGTDRANDMDELLTVPMNNPELDAVSREVSRLLNEYPPKDKAWFDHPEAIDTVRRMIEQLRTSPEQPPADSDSR